MDFTPSERETFALQRGDIVLAEGSGSAEHVGRPAMWGDELPLCCFQNTVVRFRPHATLSEFALLVFRHYVAAGVFAGVARGVGIQHLGGSRFAQLPFPLPPLAEQRRISEEAKSRTNELRLAQVSLRSALERTHQQDVEILAAAVLGELVSSDGAARPSGADGLSADWRWTRVDEAGDVQLGKQRSPASHTGPDMRPYLRVANVQEDRLDLTDVKEMNFTDEEASVYALEPGDILLNEGQSPEFVGRPAMYRGELPGACFQKTLLRFRAGPDVDPEFALLVFRHYLHAGEFRRTARWSTNIAHLTRVGFAAMRFPVPPLHEQREIAAEARRRLATSSEQREAISTSLAGLEAMSGEIYAAAVSGSLVAQDPSDESAADLLARLGPPPRDQTRTEDVRHDEVPVTKQERSHATAVAPVPKLAEVLRDSGPQPVPELCKAAGFDLNDVGEIERFYTFLRAELDNSIRAAGNDRENQQLEAIVDAS